MKQYVVPDASVLVALLLDSGSSGQWSAETLNGADLIAPSLAIFETANIIRRHALTGQVSHDQATQAHADLLDMAIEIWPYDVLAKRAWELRHNISIYDASYVAVAELTGATLVTLDQRLSVAPGPCCTITVPGS